MHPGDREQEAALERDGNGDVAMRYDDLGQEPVQAVGLVGLLRQARTEPWEHIAFSVPVVTETHISSVGTSVRASPRVSMQSLMSKAPSRILMLAWSVPGATR